jgi:flagellin
MPVINTNTAANSALRNLNLSSAKSNKFLQQLSSGLRINNAKDDAAGLAISLKVGADSRALGAASINAKNVQAVLNTAEGGLFKIADVLARANELMTLARSGFNDTASFSAIDKEYQALVSEVTSIATNTKFNGVSLLDGAGAAGTFTNVSGALVLLGAASGDTLAITITSAAVGANATATGLALATTAVTTSAVALANQALIQTAIGTNAGFIAAVGALQSRVGYRAEQIDISIENADAAVSALKDADIAAAQTNYTTADVLSQSGIAALAAANQKAQSILRLLQ